jgi:hypothetical protein
MKRTGKRIVASAASDRATHRVTAPLVPVRHEMCRDEAFTPLKPTGGNAASVRVTRPNLKAATDAEVVMAYLVFQGHGPVDKVAKQIADMSPDWVKGFARIVRDTRRSELAPAY